MTRSFKDKLTSFIKPSPKPNFWRLLLVVGGGLGTYFGVLIGLLTLWYASFDQMQFHWFDDSQEWLFCDKLGHFYIAFIECRLAINLLRWCGWKSNWLIPTSVFWAFGMQSGYEIFDGFSVGYGASVYDLMANFLGAFTAGIQFKIWNKIFLSSKFSFLFTPYPQVRPEMLGYGFWQELVKDYNGQTYWFSIDLEKSDVISRFWPKWLVLSFGYGGDGLLGGDDNVWTNQNGQSFDMSHVPRARRFAISFDIRWDLIFPKQKWLKYPVYFFDFYKFPLPALEWHQIHGFRWFWIYW
ncbi:MAG: DUF2279 domain-containing protein [Cytophagales bacterium]